MTRLASSWFWSSCLALCASAGALSGCAGEPPPAPKTPPPRVASPEAPKVAEPLTADEVLFSLRGHESDVSNCFTRSGEGTGLVRLNWVVDEEGEVLSPEVERSTSDAGNAGDCLAELVKELRFT